MCHCEEVPRRGNPCIMQDKWGVTWSSGIHPARLSQANKCVVYLSLFPCGITAQTEVYYYEFKIVRTTKENSPCRIKRTVLTVFQRNKIYSLAICRNRDFGMTN